MDTYFHRIEKIVEQKKINIYEHNYVIINMLVIISFNVMSTILHVC